MIKRFALNFSAALILSCCYVMHVKGYSVCPRNFTERINLTTKLESNLLLPCNFDPAVIQSIQNLNTSVVWSHSSTVDIVELKVTDGVISFWNNRERRIKAFSYISGSGNFSIFIQNVQESDLGLYRCELFKDSNCILSYKEINIGLADVGFSLISNWLLILGGAGFLLLCFTSVCGFYTRGKADEKRTFTSVVYRSLP